MRILGKIHDYYDGCLSYGMDPTLIFDRESSPGPVEISDEIKHRIQDSHPELKYGMMLTRVYGGDCLSLEVIGFCGKLYPYIRLDTTSALFIGKMKINECFYTEEHLEKLKSILDTSEMESMRQSYFMTGGRFSKLSGIDRLSFILDAVKSIDLTHVFIENKIPYFSVNFSRQRDSSPVVFCPVLKDSQFYKVKDPYTAFQDISMYLGGVIPRQMPEIVEISDADRIQQHGFDRKSFRHPIK